MFIWGYQSQNYFYVTTLAAVSFKLRETLHNYTYTYTFESRQHDLVLQHSLIGLVTLIASGHRNQTSLHVFC